MCAADGLSSSDRKNLYISYVPRRERVVQAVELKELACCGVC